MSDTHPIQQVIASADGKKFISEFITAAETFANGSFNKRQAVLNVITRYLVHECVCMLLGREWDPITDDHTIDTVTACYLEVPRVIERIVRERHSYDRSRGIRLFEGTEVIFDSDNPDDAMTDRTDNG